MAEEALVKSDIAHEEKPCCAALVARPERREWPEYSSALSPTDITRRLTILQNRMF